ncbi:MAG TPA: bifunctional oligoribonuclease/PAP phosphatase NrnA, partial [Armatimonadota bacterium]|nr:bifunctional oligoribonuclease/PAP phosphatase NrnA [Armatimonadota bacterium]
MKSRQERLSQAASRIQAANRILLACHVRPDADALGSLLGLAQGLQGLGKEVQAVSPDGVPELYRFLPGWEQVRTTAEGAFDLAIGLDADGSDRLGTAEAVVLAAPVVIDLDHHTGPDPFGDVRLVDSTAAASGELVYHLLRELNAPVTREIAVCLLAAILTDTGSFRFTNVTAETYRIAAALVEAGAHPAPIHEAVYGTRPFAASRLLGYLLCTLQRAADGRVVWAGLTQEDFRRCEVGTDATEGFVDQIRMVEGAEVALFFREDPDGQIRVSLRSRGKVNVARVAQEFDGG